MKNILPLFLFAALLAVPAVAEHHEGAGHAEMEKSDGPCKADMEKFCKDITPGEGRKIACLKAHSDKLSADCKAQGEKMKAHHKEMREGMHHAMEACKADKEKFCKDVETGGGKLKDCMMSHESELSSGCKEAHGKMKEMRGKMKAERKGEKK